MRQRTSQEAVRTVQGERAAAGGHAQGRVGTEEGSKAIALDTIMTGLGKQTKPGTIHYPPTAVFYSAVINN